MPNVAGAAKAAPNSSDAQKFERDASWLGARLKEPSTYAGLSVLLALVFHVSNADHLAANLTTIGEALGTIILAVVAIVMPEKGGKAAIAFLIGVPVAFALFGTQAHAATKTAATDPLTTFMDQVGKIDSAATAAVIVDITAADTDAGTVVIAANPSASPPTAEQVRDPIAHACYPALITFLKSTPTFTPMTGKLQAFQLFQRKRDFVAQLKAGIPTYLQLGCVPLLGDEANTFVQVMAMVGVKIAPAAVAAICPPCAVAVAPITLPALTLTP